MRFDDRDGRRWKVRRRWLPWRRRIRDVPELPDGPSGDDPISAILGLITLILAIPALVVLTILLAELLLLLVLLPVVVLLRFVAAWAGFPWTIEASSRPATRRAFGWTLRHEERVKGWRASGRRIEALRDEVVAGRLEPSVRHDGDGRDGGHGTGDEGDGHGQSDGPAVAP